MRPSIDPARARALIRRAIDKAEELSGHGAVAVADELGAIISASRMDDAGALGMRTGRSKAYIAAATRLDSSAFMKLLVSVPALLAQGYLSALPRPVFVGAGAMLIRDQQGLVIGSIATSGATMGPFVKYPGCDPRKLMVGGQPANVEDLVVAYATGAKTYVGQHGDDLERWVAAYGEPPGPELGDADGLAEAPPRSRQPVLDRAIGLADAVLELGQKAGHALGVAVLDDHGDVIQMDRAAGALGSALDMAELTAVGAALFGRPSHALPDILSEAQLTAFMTSTGRPICTAAGAVALKLPGVAALGVGGADPVVCGEIARTVAEQMQ